MPKVKPYEILLKTLPLGKTVVQFELNDVFFEQFENPEITGGEVEAIITINRKSSFFEVSFQLKGFVTIPCDRCLDDMKQLIDDDEELLVKFGDFFSDENEIIIVPESKGVFDVTWLLYEFVVLSIPVQHTHEADMCNEEMMNKLSEHLAYSVEDDDDDLLLDPEENDEIKTETTDARWDALKKISNKN